VSRPKKKLSLAPLARFGKIQGVYLEGPAKDIEVVSDLPHLRSLTLRSITLPDFALLRPLANLRALELKLGGTSGLSLLPQRQGLEYLEPWMVRGLSDHSPISRLPNLEYLFLHTLRQVKALPVMTELVSLRRLCLETI
jgi:internalin A